MGVIWRVVLLIGQPLQWLLLFSFFRLAGTHCLFIPLVLAREKVASLTVVLMGSGINMGSRRKLYLHQL